MARLRPVLDRARGEGATVHLDTEHDEAKDLGYELLRRIGERVPRRAAGLRRPGVPDGRVRRSPRPGRVVGGPRCEVPLQIRLVKGAYWDVETIVAGAAGWPLPVFARKAETDANYERCTTYLVDHAGEVRPAFASHNLRSLAYAIVVARDGASSARRARAAAAVRHGRAGARRARAARVTGCACTPRSASWSPGMAYLVRRLLENTSNESFVRHRFAEGRELDELDPRASRRRGSAPRRRADPTGPARRPTRTRRRRSPTSRPPSCGGPRRAPASRVASVTPSTRSRLRRARARRRAGRRDRRARSSRSTRVRSTASCAAAAAPTRAMPTRALDVAAAAWPAWRARRRGASEPRCSSEPRRSCGRGGTSSPRSRSSKPASRSPRPTPTCARRSTSASTTAARRSGSAGGVASAPGARARRTRTRYEPRGDRRRDRAVELPARDPDRHGHRRARHRQRGAVQAGGADAGDRAAAGRDPPRGRRPARRARLPPRRRRGGRRRTWSSTRRSRSSRSPARRRSASQIIERGRRRPARASGT